MSQTTYQKLITPFGYWAEHTMPFKVLIKENYAEKETSKNITIKFIEFTKNSLVYSLRKTHEFMNSNEKHFRKN